MHGQPNINGLRWVGRLRHYSRLEGNIQVDSGKGQRTGINVCHLVARSPPSLPLFPFYVSSLPSNLQLYLEEGCNGFFLNFHINP